MRRVDMHMARKSTGDHQHEALALGSPPLSRRSLDHRSGPRTAKLMRLALCGKSSAFGANAASAAAMRRQCQVLRGRTSQLDVCGPIAGDRRMTGRNEHAFNIVRNRGHKGTPTSRRYTKNADHLRAGTKLVLKMH
jgi:hypothetical protein